LCGKYGISVNLHQHREVGSPVPKAGMGINMFKEPVALAAGVATKHWSSLLLEREVMTHNSQQIQND
jgi:hypothetical protein